jgi:Flp pilus assembly protein TadG
MRQRRSEKGASAVEFALVLPILLFVVFAIIDFGWLFYVDIQVTNAARDGARWGAAREAGSVATDGEDRAEYVLSQYGLTGTATSTCSLADGLEITLSHDFQPLVGAAIPFLGNILDLIWPASLSATAVFNVENGEGC